MSEVWIPITVAAAFFQNLRSALQKKLKGKLSTAGVTYVRFFYSWPFALLYVLGLCYWAKFPIPDPNYKFFAFSMLGGISQIIFTALLIWMFSFRNFAVGTIFSKTEVLQVAVFGLVLLGDSLTLLSGAAIGISVGGICILSIGKGQISLSTLILKAKEKSTLIGLASGFFLGISVVFFRGASLALDYNGTVMAAAYTLLFSVTFQTIVMGFYFLWRGLSELTAVLSNWRSGLQVGIVANFASICWFTAFSIQNAAYVRALGQIELVFTCIATIFFFREKISYFEAYGIALVTLGIVLLVLA